MTYLKSIEKQRSTIRVVEQCTNSEYNRSIICHDNTSYNYTDILTVSFVVTFKF